MNSEPTIAGETAQVRTQDSPSVSVVMSAHNEERYLREAVASITRQTYDDFEFVIVDDGSTDRTPEILRELAAEDSRIRVVSGKNRGLTAALNVGWRQSRGELIARMDADDFSLPDRLEQQTEFLNAHPEHVAVGCQMVFIDEDGEPVLRYKQPTEHEEIDRLHLLGESGIIPHPGAMIRRSALEQVGGYREEFAVSQDYDLWLRLAEIGYIGNCPNVHLHYRTRLDNVSARRATLQTSMVRLALEEACRRRGIPFPREADEHLSQSSDQHDRRESRLRWVIQAANNENNRTARKHLWRLVMDGGSASRIARGLAYVLFPIPERRAPTISVELSRVVASTARRAVLAAASVLARMEHIGVGLTNGAVRCLRPMWRKVYCSWLTMHALVLDRPILAWPALFPRLSGRSWIKFRNRGERLHRAPDGRGYETRWRGATPLRISQRLPGISRRILEAATHEWPIHFATTHCHSMNEAPDVSFIVGHRGEARFRHLNRTLETLLAQVGCRCEFLVVEQDTRPLLEGRLPAGVRHVFDACDSDMPYNRSRSFNVGAREARGRLLVLHDNDLLAPTRYGAELVRLANAGYEAMKIYRYIFYLRKETTERVLANHDLTRPRLDRIAQNNVGGSVALLRDTYFEIGGHDESFEGWGQEDLEMFDRCQTVSCYAFGYLPLVHLHHEPQPMDRLNVNQGLLGQRRRLRSRDRAVQLSQQLRQAASAN